MLVRGGGLTTFQKSTLTALGSFHDFDNVRILRYSSSSCCHNAGVRILNLNPHSTSVSASIPNLATHHRLECKVWKC